MKNILAIAIKELYIYFVSPIAYFVLIIFNGLSGFFFYAILRRAIVRQELSTAILQVLFRNYISVTLLFFIPAITMRLFAEERRSGTIELLLTSPIRDLEIVFGKFLACFCLYLIMLATTAFFPLLIKPFGSPDPAQIISGYFGMILFGGAFLSFGMFVSSLTKNQIVAALTTFGVLLSLWMIGSFSDRSGVVSGLLKSISPTEHLNEFTRGVIAIKDVVYYLTFTAICIFSTIRSIESAKWR